MEKTIKLYKLVGKGSNVTPFPNAEDQIEIGAFRYDAKRMGGAPTITASVMYPQCLDDKWTDTVYAEFNGEKYYLKQTPTSSYSNEDERYKHDLELVSERRILDDVYFFDVVTGDPTDSDKPVSNSTKVVFFGSVHEFVARLNASLAYSHIDYEVVVDDDVETEEKLMSFEDQFFSNVLQEIYNTYEVPYYFDGKTIHIGKSMPLEEGEDIPTFSYGVDNALLSITKNNANYKIVNRVTGTGSSDNIPFYYPNNSPKGEIAVDATSASATFTIINGEAFSNEVAIGDVVKYGSGFARSVSTSVSDDGNKWISYDGEDMPIAIVNMKPTQKWFSYTFQVNEEGKVKIGGTITIDGHDRRSLSEFISFAEINNRHGKSNASIKDGYVDCGRLDSGSHTLKMGLSFPYLGRINYTIAASFGTEMASGWYNETQDKETSLEKMGLAYSGTLSSGDTITQRLVKYVKTSQKLMPSIYRETDGEERFYNATNGTYNNPYTEGRPKEHIITVEDIKPTITGTEVIQPEGSTFAGSSVRIDMFSEFAYDRDDNDETYEDDEGNVYFKHPYFYGKLRVMDFNLFDHAIENQPMTISFTSGDCGACNFEIGVTEEYPQKNPVQVDANGNLLRDANGMVLAGVEGTQQSVSDFQERQQDTSKYDVWIALKKEEETYGILMPQVAHRPKADTTGENKGDTFVILGINLPQSYIINAEKKLEAEIIKYLKENNDEKFTFSIGFSRIFFEENDILEQLSENSRIRIIYDSKPYDLYVSSFSYSMSEGDILPEIRVELDETLKVSQNALQNAISQVKSELGKAINNIDVIGAASPYFIRKDEDDEVRGRINFKKGIKFGEGGKVEVMDNNSAKLTIEYLEVTKKASFTSLEIQEKTHVGGQILVTPAAINCGEVEELEDAYRCYFQTKGTDGDEIFNQFAVGDQAICQTYNAWGSKYYWRLVTNIGEDYIDLSKTDCDEDSGIPSAGDKIIQLGNQVDTTRQNAIVIAAYGDGSPHIIQYKGINGFELTEDKIVTKLSSTENIFTGKVHMEMGSVISEDVLGDLSGALTGAIEGLEFGKYNLLRNSGFTGDFVTESLDDGKVLDENSQLFSDPLRHWTVTNGEVNANSDSQSGYECNLNDGSLKQEMMYNMIEGESYVFSFRGRGMSLTFSVGGVTKEIALGTEQTRYIEKFVAINNSNIFEITNASGAICELQLERGNVVSAWGHSMWDNQSEIAKYQALNYLESAIKNGSTDILGGLIMSNIMLLGNPQVGDNTAGMSGIRNDDNDVAFWGGGSYSQAIETVMKYVEDPNYQPTEEDIASMAKAVITHGGRAILNDIILRGIIYAKGGSFGDLKIGKYVNACGQADAEDSVFSELKQIVGDIVYSTVVKMSAGAISSYGSYNTPSQCFTGNTVIIDADANLDENPHKAVMYLRGGNVDAMCIEAGDIKHLTGQYKGLRTPTRVVTNSYTVDATEDSVIIADTTNNALFVYVPIPSQLLNGAFVEIHNVGNASVTLDTNGIGYIHYNGTSGTQKTLEPSKTARLVFSGERNTWYMTII